MRNPKILVLEKDESLASQVRGVAGELRPRPEVVACDRATAVEDAVNSDGPFDVLIAGPSLSSKTGLAALQAIHDETPGTSLVLAFNKRPDATLRDIIRTGAMDMLQLPVADKNLHDAVERAVALSRTRPGEQGTSSPSTAPAANLGTVFTVSSATGGCGKTFYATNLAYYLHQYTGKRTCIVDLDLQFGEVSTALRLRPNYTIYDALQREGDDFDFGDHLDEFLVGHEGGFSVLAAPKDPAEADRIGPADVTRILDVLRSHCDYLVVDTPAALTEVVLAAFDVSEHLFSLATVDLPSVRNLGVFLQTLDKLRIPADNISLILNKAERDVGLDIGQITRLFPQGFKAILPYAREVSRSINMGMPVLASDPTAEVSRKLAACLLEYLPDAERAKAKGFETPVKNPSRFKLFGRAMHLTTAGNAS